jgi:hypothetical protein
MCYHPVMEFRLGAPPAPKRRIVDGRRFHIFFPGRSAKGSRSEQFAAMTAAQSVFDITVSHVSLSSRRCCIRV